MRDHVARFHGTTIDEPESGRLGVLEWTCAGEHRTTADGFVCTACRASV